MTVASFIAAQRTDRGVTHALSCRALDVPESTFYKWRDRQPTPLQRRRADPAAAVKASFDDSGGTPATYGSPRVWEDLVEAGWKVSKKSVAASMARPGCAGTLPETETGENRGRLSTELTVAAMIRDDRTRCSPVPVRLSTPRRAPGPQAGPVAATARGWRQHDRRPPRGAPGELRVGRRPPAPLRDPRP